MSTLLKTLGLITGCASVSYLTVTAMMRDPNKPYRGHLNVIKGGISTKNIYIPTETSENTDVSQNLTLDPSTSQSPPQSPSTIVTL
jgi:hypothetical protein